MKNGIIASMILLALLSQAFSQNSSRDTTVKKYFVGSTLFMFIGNVIPDDPNPPDFVQLNVGYRHTPKDVFSVELKTWKYAWPLGIPYGDSRTDEIEKYPGFVRSFGIGLVYQRFLWKGVYASVDAMNTLQRYVDNQDHHIQNGYQLFMTYRLGYHLKFLKNRFFFEPSIAVTHWPITTNVPESFASLEKKWPNYFLMEPGLHFGINF